LSYLWQLIEDQCTGCGICVDVCPEEAILLPRHQAYPRGLPGKCTGCLVCWKECPFGAIEIIQVKEEGGSAQG